MEGEFLYNPGGIGGGAHCASLVRLPGRDLLATWYAYPGTEDYKNARLILARRLSDGRGWEKARVIPFNFDSSLGNPVLFIDERTKYLWLLFVVLKGSYWTDAYFYGAHSTDQGESWSEPRVLSGERGLMIRHAPVRMGDCYLLPAYREEQNISVLLKWDSENWKTIYEFSDSGLIQPALVKEQGEGLSIFFRPSREPALIGRAHSHDGGASWSQIFRTSLPCPLSGIAALKLSEKTVIFYNHSNEHKRTPLSVASSNDGGVVWGAPTHLDIAAHEVSYPSFILGNDGLLHGVYTYNRRMIKYVSMSQEEIA